VRLGFFKKIEDNGATSLAYLLLRDFVSNCVLASAIGTGCMLVEAESTSRYSKTKS
jgi:hypothetical protein